MSEKEQQHYKRRVLIKRLKFLPDFKDIDFDIAEKLLQDWKDYVYDLEQKSRAI